MAFIRLMIDDLDDFDSFDPDQVVYTWNDVIFSILSYMGSGEPITFPESFGDFIRFKEINPIIKSSIENHMRDVKLAFYDIFDNRNPIIIDRFNTILDQIAADDKNQELVKIANELYIARPNTNRVGNFSQNSNSRKTMNYNSKNQKLVKFDQALFLKIWEDIENPPHAIP